MVAGAVGALPLAHGRVLLRVLGRVQVAGQAHAADNQLAVARDGEIPAVQRPADRHRLTRVQPLRAGHHGRLGGAVGVPHLAALGQPVGQLLGAGLAAHDEQADIIQRHLRPQPSQGGHGGHDRDVAADQPRAQVLPGTHQGARGRHQAGAVAPGQPHFLAGGVEGHGQAGQHAVVRPERVVLAEQARLRVHKRGCRAVRDGHALRLACGAGGEDDPAVVVRGDLAQLARFRGLRGFQHPQPLVGEDRVHVRLAEHRLSALVRVVRVHRHVRAARAHRGQDGQVELPASRRHPDPHPAPITHTLGAHDRGAALDFLHELRVGEHAVIVGVGAAAVAVVDGSGVGVLGGGGREDVDKRPLRRDQVAAQEWIRGVFSGLRHADKANDVQKNRKLWARPTICAGPPCVPPFRGSSYQGPANRLWGPNSWLLPAGSAALRARARAASLKPLPRGRPQTQGGPWIKHDWPRCWWRAGT